jgi:hypothetical protein
LFDGCIGNMFSFSSIIAGMIWTEFPANIALDGSKYARGYEPINHFKIMIPGY